MSLKFTTTKLASAQEAYSLQKLELLNATEALNSAWMDLTDAQREIDGLQEIMDNVHQSVEMLTKFGADAIPMLNADGGLEALLQIPERLITVEKANEGLVQGAIDGLKEFFKKVGEFIGKIVEFLRNLFTSTKHKLDYVTKLTEFKPSNENKYTMASKANAINLVNSYSELWQFSYEIMDGINAHRGLELAKKIPERVAALRSKASNAACTIDDDGVFTLAENILVEQSCSEAGFNTINDVKAFVGSSTVGFASLGTKFFNSLASSSTKFTAKLFELAAKKHDDEKDKAEFEDLRRLTMMVSRNFKCENAIIRILVNTLTAIYTEAHKKEAPAA